MSKSGIYRIRNRNNQKIYVGSSADLPKRESIHFRKLKNGKHHSPKLQASYDKHGAEAFVFEVIEYVEPAQLIQREQYYIDTLNPFYNISPTAGSTAGIKRSPEAVAKWRESYSYSHDEDTRARMSASHTGKPIDPESVRKSSAARTGLKRSQESKDKMREAKLGKKRPYQKRNCSGWTPERRAKVEETWRRKREGK